MALQITGDPAADRVLDESPFALLAGMLLDQHMRQPGSCASAEVGLASSPLRAAAAVAA